MINIIMTLVLLVILGAAIGYIVKNSKKGVKCIGCPYAKGCTNTKPCGSAKNTAK